MTPELSEITRLQAGQSLRMAVEPGFALIVAEGRVSVQSPPAWVGETMVGSVSVHSEGEAFVAARGGWISVTAHGPAQLRALPAAAPASPSRVMRLVQLLLA